MEKKDIKADSAQQHLEEFLDGGREIDPTRLSEFMKTPGGEDLADEMECLARLDDLEPDREKMLAAVHRGICRPPRRRLAARYAAAIIILAAAGTGLWRWNSARDTGSGEMAVALMPGTPKAFLQMSDGKEIVLDGETPEQVIEEGGALLRVLSSGTIRYTGGDKPVQTAYNKLIVPRRAEYKLELADGSVVHLNSESELTYPVGFGDGERRVALRGEGYFDVARDKAKPFVVEVGDMEVNVLGTRFNVNAYRDRGIVHTVLVEGSVEVRHTEGESLAVLTPGQQADYDGSGVSVTEVNPGEAISWVSGSFHFDQVSLEDIMFQLERWYDITVHFADESLRSFEFTGMVRRDFTAEQVFGIMEKTAQVRFTVNGRDITVAKK